MTPKPTLARPPRPHHAANIASIASVFAVWKILLAAIVAASPGPGYDTSTVLMLTDPRADVPVPPTSSSLVNRILVHVLTRFVRWDSVYFINIAQRGYVYEQEWAFGRGFHALMAWVAERLNRVLPDGILPAPLLRQALAGVLVSHVSHLLACFLLYALTLRLLPKTSRGREGIAVLAACLHVLSPAGVFLSGPCTEASFACLNFLGFYLLTFVPGLAYSGTLFAVGGAVCFALASTVRGNGFLSVVALGIIAFPIVLRIIFGKVQLVSLWTFLGLVAGALITLVGTALPQYQPYVDYCQSEQSSQRPWCKQLPPSIYFFVQSHYWGNGFLKYWTLSNLPLFLIAVPVLSLLFITSVKPVWSVINTVRSSGRISDSTVIIAMLAGPQLALSVLALTSFHVQIINRISTGYPLWYIVLAASISQTNKAAGPNELTKFNIIGMLEQPHVQRRIVKTMMLYAIIQAGLYSSFLPPA